MSAIGASLTGKLSLLYGRPPLLYFPGGAFIFFLS